MAFRTATLALALIPTLAVADGHSDDVAALAQALQLEPIIEVIRLEGLAYGDQLANDLFPGPIPAEWPDLIDAIYDLEQLERRLMANLEAELDGADIAPMITYYTTDPGATIAQLEAEARRARLDADVEQASIESAALAAMEDTPRFQQLESLVAANDVVETNIVAAMNFNYAFYLGLVEGGAMGGDISESQILADVWAQEPMIRSQTNEWVYSFYHLALQPVSDADVDSYIAFAESDAGSTLDQALLNAFEPVFLDISRALGLAAAQMMVVQEL